MKNLNMYSAKKNGGFTLIEALVVIGGGLVLWAIVSNFLGGTGDSTTSMNEGLRLKTIKTCAKSRQSGVSDYATFTQQGLINAQCLQQYGMVNTANTAILNTAKAGVTVAITSVNGVANNALRITSPTLAANICNKTVMNTHQEWANVTVNATPIKTTAGLIVNPDTVSTACNNATNSIIVDFT